MINSIAVRTFRRAAVAVFAAGALGAPVHAQFYQNSTGLSNAATSISFSEQSIADYTAVTNQFAAQGITFSAGIFYNAQGPASFPGISGDYVGNFNSVPAVLPTTPFSVYFNSAQTRAGFGFVTNPSNTLFEAYLGGVLMASSNLVATSYLDPNSYFGFDGVTFDEIRITRTGDESALLDNVQYGGTSVVPEPGSFVLLGSMLIPGAAILRRRRNAKK